MPKKQDFPSTQARLIEQELRKAGACLMADDKIQRSGGVNLFSTWVLQRRGVADICILQDHGDNMGATVYWSDTSNSLTETLKRIRGEKR